MKVYIAGPMQGYANFNYDAFDQAERELRAVGHEPINPANNFDRRQDLPYEYYLQRSLEQVREADAIIMLPGWTMSRGARTELSEAERHDKLIMYWRSYFNSLPENDKDPSCILPPMQDEPERITDEAWKLVVKGERQSSYGHPAQDFRTTGRQWAAILENWLKHEDIIDFDFPDIPPKLVALMMAQLKLSRESHAPKRDNRVDAIGYIICADRIEEDY